MNELVERLRTTWDNFNDRERRLLTILGVVVTALILIVPLYWIARQNSDLETQNQELREVLALIDERRAELDQFAAARKASARLYKNKTPPLGSFLETQANKHEISLREVIDQPEKSAGRYHRRSAKATVNETGLTGLVRVLDDIVKSPYPVAIGHIKIEHYQPGDKYRFAFGVLTFDKPSKLKADTADTADEADTEG